MQVLREDFLDQTVKLNVEYKVGSDTFVSVNIEKVSKNLVEDGLLQVERRRSLKSVFNIYKEVMSNAKKNQFNIIQIA